MSFGFSIGDIVLLSQLAYNLYSSVTSGRKAASRDLKELEDVLFSLRCALDHLKDVANELLARSDDRLRHGGAPFREKLDHILNSCGKTLQELDDMTKKYREIVIEEPGSAKKGVHDRLRVSWWKIRWDQERQSLQQYREKLRSHTDAISIILMAVTWTNTSSAESSSKTSHEKTHSLLQQILSNPQVDSSLGKMIEQIHTILTQKQPEPVTSELVFQKPDFRGSVAQLSKSPLASGMNPAVNVFTMNAPVMPHWNTLPDRKKLSREAVKSSVEPPASIMFLNKKRQAFGEKEFESFGKLHSKMLSKPEPRASRNMDFSRNQKRTPTLPKPDWFKEIAPTLHQLHHGLQYIFQLDLESDSHLRYVNRWMEAFCRLVEGSHNDGIITLLIELNEAINSSNESFRCRFYQVVDKTSFKDVLDELQNISKSVRVMKAVEEFQDAKEEWKYGGSGE